MLVSSFNLSQSFNCLISFTKNGFSKQRLILSVYGPWRDVANVMTAFCVHMVIDQHQTGASDVVHQGRRHGPSIRYKIAPCWDTLNQPARRAAVLGQPSSLASNYYHV